VLHSGAYSAEPRALHLYLFFFGGNVLQQQNLEPRCGSAMAKYAAFASRRFGGLASCCWRGGLAQWH